MEEAERVGNEIASEAGRVEGEKNNEDEKGKRVSSGKRPSKVFH